MRRIVLVAALTVLAVTAAPLAQTSTWRPVVLSDTGMIASGHALASEAGIRVLKSGGNAVDAAVAAWAVQGLTEPEMTGLGGDMFMLIYLAKTGEVKFINGTGVAPMAANVDFYKGKGGIPGDGILSVSVPAAVGGRRAGGEDVRHQAARANCWRRPSSSPSAASPSPNRSPARSAAAARRCRHPPRRSGSAATRRSGFGDRVVQKDLAATLARDRRQGQRRVLSGADRREVCRLHES